MALGCPPPSPNISIPTLKVQWKSTNIETLLMMDTTNKVVMPRMRDIVKAEGVDPSVGAALSTAAS